MMNHRILAFGVVSAGAALAACSGSEDATESGVAADGPASAPAAQVVFNYPDGSPHPTTSWGDPDLTGMWPIMHIFTTPLQRPEEFGTRRIRTEEEIAAAQAGMERRDANYHQMVENRQLGMGGWAESTTRVDAIALTSLISYPEDGRFPGLTARGEELRPLFEGDDTPGQVFDSPTEDFDTWDRCITRGLPSSMLPYNYNNGIRIFQSPGYVVIDLEMIHESRVVPIDQAPLDAGIRQWLGSSRGHWEGSTLVVETTNFNGEVNQIIAGIPGAPRGEFPTTTNMRTTERLTRVADDRIDYEITIEDPEVLNDKWTISYPMILDPEYQFYEYACHEDNTAVRNFIETSRYERANPDEFPAQEPGGFGGGRGPGAGANR
jgi:hypothetical protein